MTTPRRLQLGTIVVCIPVVMLAVAIQIAVSRNDDTVQTVGEDATQGITIAQRIKLNLAELDDVAVGELLAPTEPGAQGAASTSGFPRAYNAKRTELHDNLVSAAAHSSGAAFEQTLVKIDYVLGHYHSLMADSFAANAAQDPTTALERYAAAHVVMSQTLLPEADRFDKANTYVLNDSYGRQQRRSASTDRWLAIACLTLVGVLIVAQVQLARKFKRILNVGLLAATVLAGLTGAAVWGRLEASERSLAAARDEAFDAVHQLARARAVVVSAKQAQGHYLLDPANAPATAAAFEAETDKVFRVAGASPDQIADQIENRLIEGDAAGYLAGVNRITRGSSNRGPTLDALEAFGQFLTADGNMRGQLEQGDRDGAVATYRAGAGADELAAAIDVAQSDLQATFDGHVDDAQAATRGLSRINLVVAAGLVALIVSGFYFRLREYSA